MNAAAQHTELQPLALDDRPIDDEELELQAEALMALAALRELIRLSGLEGLLRRGEPLGLGDAARPAEALDEADQVLARAGLLPK